MEAPHATDTTMTSQSTTSPAELTASPVPPTEILAAGERFTLLPDRAAFWGRTRTLFLSDVHLGKAQTLAAAGIGLPVDAILEAQLQAITGVIQRVRAERVFIIGDLIHAPIGLTTPLIEKVAQWRTTFTTDLLLIPGNHDRKIELVASSWNIQITDPVYQEGPFTFVHDPASASSDGEYLWSGHTHPAAYLRQGKGGFKIPCFYVGQTFTVLPAFSHFTGGVVIKPAPNERLFGLVSDRVIAL